MGIFRDIFGPSRQEIWGQFAKAVGGDYSQGGFLSGRVRVDAAHGQWVVTLDTQIVNTGKSTTTYTRMRAPYVNPDGFRFNVYRKGLFSDLAKLFGMQDVVVGHRQFDEDFIIKGNDEAKLRRLFDNDRIRELITVQPRINFRVQDDEAGFWGARNFPPDVDELYFREYGVIRNVDRLKELYDLFSETLDELCRMGSAYQKVPEVRI